MSFVEAIFHRFSLLGFPVSHHTQQIVMGFTKVTLSDLKSISFLGAGAFSTVRLVEHRRPGPTRFDSGTVKQIMSSEHPKSLNM